MVEEKMEVDWGNDKLQKAQKQIDDSPFDLEAWSLLIREAQTKWIGEMRPLFEKLVLTFPSAGRYWKIYIEQERRVEVVVADVSENIAVSIFRAKMVGNYDFYTVLQPKNFIYFSY